MNAVNEWMGDTESWGLILGAVSPLAIAMVQQPRWTPRVRWLVGWGAAIAIGLLTCLARGDFDEGGTVLATVALTVVASQAAYAGLKKGPVPAIEKATSPTPARPPEPPAEP